MKELKLKEIKVLTEDGVEVNDERYSLDLEYGIKLKPFYTWEEKSIIFETMKAVDNELIRDMVLRTLTARFCTNIDFNEMTDNEEMTDSEIYDVIAELDLMPDFKVNIDEYMDMPKLVEREESTYKALTSIISSINDMLKDFDMSKIQEGFNGLGGVIGDVNNNK